MTDHRHLLAGAGLAFLALVALGVFALADMPLPGEKQMLDALSGVDALAAMGNAPWPLALLVPPLGFVVARWRGVAVATAALVLAVLLAELVLVPTVARPRPSGAASFAAFGFPSATGVLAGAEAVLLVLAANRRIRPWAWILAVLVLVASLGRAAAGAHWPGDVIGGWALGIAAMLTAAAFGFQAARRPRDVV